VAAFVEIVMSGGKVEAALELLRTLGKGEELTLKEAVEIIELVTRSPELIRRTIERGEAEGLFERRESRIRFRKEAIRWPDDSPQVRVLRGEDRCRRCGRKITLCHYLQVVGREIGPFGSECVRRIKNHEE
jgi:hypothetical protein